MLNSSSTQDKHLAVDRQQDRPIVIFDGDCAMCSAAVNTILKLEREPRMDFAPTNGPTFKKVIPPELHQRDTMMLHINGRTLTESDAVLKIAHQLGAPWSWAYILRYIPRALRDRLYRWVARNRYRFFGRNESCYLPAPDVRARFLP